MTWTWINNEDHQQEMSFYFPENLLHNLIILKIKLIFVMNIECILNSPKCKDDINDSIDSIYIIQNLKLLEFEVTNNLKEESYDMPEFFSGKWFKMNHETTLDLSLSTKGFTPKCTLGFQLFQNHELVHDISPKITRMNMHSWSAMELDV